MVDEKEFVELSVATFCLVRLLALCNYACRTKSKEKVLFQANNCRWNKVSFFRSVVHNLSNLALVVSFTRLSTPKLRIMCKDRIHSV